LIQSFEADSSRAHQALTDAETELDRVKNERTTAEGDIAEIFNIHGFGADGEWKKLDGTCLEKEVGECVYLLPKLLSAHLLWLRLQLYL
jgi:protein kinase C substrate 80K-H